MEKGDANDMEICHCKCCFLIISGALATFEAFILDSSGEFHSPISRNIVDWKHHC